TLSVRTDHGLSWRATTYVRSDAATPLFRLRPYGSVEDSGLQSSPFLFLRCEKRRFRYVLSVQRFD
ncbi:hypothetical protein M8C21_009952, partial [Ambrosia artemisiifolia]